MSIDVLEDLLVAVETLVVAVLDVGVVRPAFKETAEVSA